LLFRLILILIVLSLFTGTVVAYLATTSDPMSNTFQSEDQSDPQVQEDAFTNGTSMQKQNVYVQVGDNGYSVYVRAAVVVVWTDGKGNVLPQTPVLGTDYSMTLGADWEKGSDGFYYYGSSSSLKPVASGGSTTNLIVSCEPQKAAPVEGYALSVDIIAQTIQAMGCTDTGGIPAVQDAWKIAGDS